MTTTRASDTRLAVQIAKEAIAHETLRPVTAAQAQQIQSAMSGTRPARLTDVTPAGERGADFKELKVGDDVYVQKTDVAPGAQPTWFYADSISHPLSPSRPQSKGAVIDSWKAAWKPAQGGGYDFDVGQVANDAAPKGSDCERWMITDAKRNAPGGPDFWIGLYRNAQGNFLVRDDNSDVRIFNARGAFVAKANVDKMDGFMRGWPR